MRTSETTCPSRQSDDGDVRASMMTRRDPVVVDQESDGEGWGAGAGRGKEGTGGGAGGEGRDGAGKRGASAVGEGSVVVSAGHSYLASAKPA